VNGNPTMLDLGRIPAILNIRGNATVELRDLLIKNVATMSDISMAPVNVSSQLTFVSGLLTWPSFFGQPLSNLKIYNTTQYFWSYTLFRRSDCNYHLAAPLPATEVVMPCVLGILTWRPAPSLRAVGAPCRFSALWGF
jgi:hypothetical protein